jgi:hypothetical protein
MAVLRVKKKPPVCLQMLYSVQCLYRCLEILSVLKPVGMNMARLEAVHFAMTVEAKELL